VPKNVPRKNRIPLRSNDPEHRSEADIVAEPTGPGNPSGKRPGRQPPWDKGAEPEAGSFGVWLRRQRELREISLRDVAERTKISLRYLEAMEEDRFDLLPAPVFAKGFLREYARYVGLSPDEVVNHWLAVQQAGERPEGDEETASPGRSRRRLSRLLLLLVLLVLAVLAAYLYWQRRHGGSPAPATGSAPAHVGAGPAGTPGTPPAPAPLASPPAASPVSPVPSAASPVPGDRTATAAAALPAPPTPPETEAPPAPLEVNLDFSRECWVEALIDGKRRIAEQRVAGEALRLPAQHTVQLTLGDAGAAEVQVNGTPLPLPVTGKGQVLKDFMIDLDTLKTLKARKETR
jgi:cytoskeleton protein RodZ